MCAYDRFGKPCKVWESRGITIIKICVFQRLNTVPDFVQSVIQTSQHHLPEQPFQHLHRVGA
jgi:hypothetical protein